MRRWWDRRDFVALSGRLLAGSMLGSAGLADAMASATPAGSAVPDSHPVQSRLLQRIAFGSCAHQDKEQRVWDAVNALEPDLFLFLGDNVYGDTRDMDELRARYAALAAQPGFRRLRARTPLLAIWDDHDYGENDAGAEYPFKEQSRRIFCDFWGEPADSPRRSRNGIYAGYVFGPRGRQVQILLPDLRFNRTPLTPRDLGGMDYDSWAEQRELRGEPVPGPYERNPDRAASMLGDAQWAWLEEQLTVPAQVRILCSSLPVAADFPGWEAWVNYARDRDRLLDAIRRRAAQGLLCLSGDTHWAELSRLDGNAPYPLWDLTSSGLTETWPVVAPNANRVGQPWRERNFGVVEFDWRLDRVIITLRILDEAGITRLEHRLDTRALRVQSDARVDA